MSATIGGNWCCSPQKIYLNYSMSQRHFLLGLWDTFKRFAFIIHSGKRIHSNSAMSSVFKTISKCQESFNSNLKTKSKNYHTLPFRKNSIVTQFIQLFRSKKRKQRKKENQRMDRKNYQVSTHKMCHGWSKEQSFLMINCQRREYVGLRLVSCHIRLPITQNNAKQIVWQNYSSLVLLKVSRCPQTNFSRFFSKDIL